MQARLREAFGRWGLPGRLRLDNGLPWGGWNDLPTALTLWLVGLGLEVEFNPPGQKQLNGVVEKSQDTGQRWCEPQKCHSPEELQGRLEAMDRIQREVYPSLQGRARQAVFPQLSQPARAYAAEQEAGQWELRRAQEYLAGHTAVRRVSGRGQVCVYARRYSVGAKHAGQEARVYYDAGSGEWVFLSAAGEVWRRLTALEISRERIVALEVSG